MAEGHTALALLFPQDTENTGVPSVLRCGEVYLRQAVGHSEWFLGVGCSGARAGCPLHTGC